VNLFAVIKLISPHPGNVKIQVSTISLTTPKLIAEILFTAPTPIIAVVFVCVVETGTPVRLESNRQSEAARSAEKP
jgi:hypothetical protein